MKDLLVYRLTGTAISSYGCQSASCLMDMRNNRFSRVLGEGFGIGEMVDRFAPLRWDIELCGTVTQAAAAQTGLAVGTPVSAGSHDVVATAIGMGAIDANCCFMIPGTHGINGYIADQPVLNGTIKNNELFAEPGKYLIEEAYPSSTGVLEWAISVLYSSDKRKSSDIYAEINDAVASVDPAQNKLLFLPYLLGSVDNPMAEGAWLGLKRFHTHAHMLEALYEGVAFAHKVQMSHLFMNRPLPEKIKAAGGATSSKVWMQMFADVLELPLELVPDGEMGVKGASIVAAVAAGIYPDLDTAVAHMTEPGIMVYPRAEMQRVYSRKFERFCRASEILGVFSIQEG